MEERCGGGGGKGSLQEEGGAREESRVEEERVKEMWGGRWEEMANGIRTCAPREEV